MARAVRFLGVAALSAGIAFGAVAPASATYENVGGGVWNHGFASNWVYSNYYHATKSHRSSVTTSRAFLSSAWILPGLNSYASLEQTIRGNKANWDVR